MGNSISTAFVIILLVAGLVVGLSVAGVDLLNPWTSVAQSQRISAETNHLDKLNRLEEQQKQAEYQAYLRQQEILEGQKIQQVAADLEYQRSLNGLKLRREAVWTEAGAVALVIVTALMALGLLALLVGIAIRLARNISAPKSAPIQIQPLPTPQADMWNDPEYRAFAISLARQAERGQPVETKPVTMSPMPVRYDNGGRRYTDLPLAGD